MLLVSESLEQLYNRERHNVSPYLELLNEGIQFKNTKDAIQKAANLLPKLAKNKRVKLLSLLFVMSMAGLHDYNSAREIKNNRHIISLADLPNPTALDIEKTFDAMKPIEKIESKGFLYVSPKLVNELELIMPNRFSVHKIDQYNKYDDEIEAAVNALRSKGQKPDANLIKTIMLIETGMKPKKNKLGYEGFPQTKPEFINAINKRYKQNFTMADMYDPYKSAQFIHYYMRAMNRSQYVKNVNDLIIAYNWGMGNLGKYKRGEKKLPSQSKDYIRMTNVMQKHYPSS